MTGPEFAGGVNVVRRVRRYLADGHDRRYLADIAHIGATATAIVDSMPS